MSSWYIVRRWLNINKCTKWTLIRQNVDISIFVPWNLDLKKMWLICISIMYNNWTDFVISTILSGESEHKIWLDIKWNGYTWEAPYRTHFSHWRHWAEEYLWSFYHFPAEDKEAGGFPPHIYLFVCSHTLNVTINDAFECWPDVTIDLAARRPPRGAWRWPRTRWWSSSCCRSSWCPPPTTASSPRSGG